MFPVNVKRPAVEAYKLTSADSAVTSAALSADASDYYYSACLSVLDGLWGIDAGFYTWPAVKMYYSIFYALRAMLAWDGVAFFYPDKAPFHVLSQPGSSPMLAHGKGTHKALLNCFKKLKPGHRILSQDIDLTGPLEWMMEKREAANYVQARFCEPRVPDCFAKIVEIGTQKASAAYFGPHADILVFDKDHAIVAFPIAVLREAGLRAIANGGAEIGKEELAFIKRRCKERSGATSAMVPFITGTLKK